MTTIQCLDPYYTNRIIFVISRFLWYVMVSFVISAVNPFLVSLSSQSDLVISWFGMMKIQVPIRIRADNYTVFIARDRSLRALLIIDYWLLIIDYWLLIIDYWLLIIEDSLYLVVSLASQNILFFHSIHVKCIIIIGLNKSLGKYSLRHEEPTSKLKYF